jgi:hypothetical protein
MKLIKSNHISLSYDRKFNGYFIKISNKEHPYFQSYLGDKEVVYFEGNNLIVTTSLPSRYIMYGFADILKSKKIPYKLEQSKYSGIAKYIISSKYVLITND